MIADAQKVQQCYLARVRSENIEDRSKFEYLVSADPVWDANLKKAIPVMNGMPNEVSVSYNKYLGCFLAVHSLGLTGVTVGRTAQAPWGPWSEPVDLWQVSTEHDKNLPYPKLIYAGKEHTELAEENGRIIYVTFIEFEDYYPHLIEITLEKE